MAATGRPVSSAQRQRPGTASSLSNAATQALELDDTAIDAVASQVTHDEAEALLRAARQAHVELVLESAYGSRGRGATATSGQGRAGSAAASAAAAVESGSKAALRERMLGRTVHVRRFERESLALAAEHPPQDLLDRSDIQGALDELKPAPSTRLTQAGLHMMHLMFERCRRAAFGPEASLRDLSLAQMQEVLAKVTPPRHTRGTSSADPSLNQAQSAAWEVSKLLFGALVQRFAAELDLQRRAGGGTAGGRGGLTVAPVAPSSPTSPSEADTARSAGDVPDVQRASRLSAHFGRTPDAALAKATDTAQWKWRRAVRCEWRLRVWCAVHAHADMLRSLFWWVFVCEQLSVRTAVAVARAREATGRDFGMLDWRAALEHSLGVLLRGGGGDTGHDPPSTGPPSLAGPARLHSSVVSGYVTVFSAASNIAGDIVASGGGRLPLTLAMAAGGHRSASSVASASALRDRTYHLTRALLVESVLAMFCSAYANSPSLEETGPLYPPSLRARVAALLDQMGGQEGAHTDLAVLRSSGGGAPLTAHTSPPVALRPWHTSQRQRFNDAISRTHDKFKLARGRGAGEKSKGEHIEAGQLPGDSATFWEVGPFGTAGSIARTELLETALQTLRTPVGAPLTIGGRPVSRLALRTVLESTSVAERMGMLLPSSRSDIVTDHIDGADAEQLHPPRTPLMRNRQDSAAQEHENVAEFPPDASRELSWASVDTETEMQLGSAAAVEATKRRKAVEGLQREAASRGGIARQVKGGPIVVDAAPRHAAGGPSESMAPTVLLAQGSQVGAGGVDFDALLLSSPSAGDRDAATPQRRRQVPKAKRRVLPGQWPPPLVKEALRAEAALKAKAAYSSKARAPVTVMPHGQRTTVGFSPAVGAHLASGHASGERASRVAARSASAQGARISGSVPIAKLVPVSEWVPPSPKTLRKLLSSVASMPASQVMQMLSIPTNGEDETQPQHIDGLVASSDQVVSSGAVILKHGLNARGQTQLSQPLVRGGVPARPGGQTRFLTSAPSGSMSTIDSTDASALYDWWGDNLVEGSGDGNNNQGTLQPGTHTGGTQGTGNNALLGATTGNAVVFARHSAAAAQWGLQARFDAGAAAVEGGVMFGVGGSSGIGGAVMTALAQEGKASLQSAHTPPPPGGGTHPKASLAGPKRSSDGSAHAMPSNQGPATSGEHCSIQSKMEAKLQERAAAMQAENEADMGPPSAAEEGARSSSTHRGHTSGAHLHVSSSAPRLGLPGKLANLPAGFQATVTRNAWKEGDADRNTGNTFLTAVILGDSDSSADSADRMQRAADRAPEDSPPGRLQGGGSHSTGKLHRTTAHATSGSPVRNAVWRNLGDTARNIVSKRNSLSMRLMGRGGGGHSSSMSGGDTGLGLALASSTLASTRRSRASMARTGQSGAARAMAAHRPEVMGRPLAGGELAVGMTTSLSATVTPADRAALLKAASDARRSKLVASVRAFKRKARAGEKAALAEVARMEKVRRALLQSRYAGRLINQLVAMRGADFDAVVASQAVPVAQGGTADRAQLRKAKLVQAAAAGSDDSDGGGLLFLLKGRSAATQRSAVRRAATVAAAQRHAKPEADRDSAHTAFVTMLTALREEFSQRMRADDSEYESEDDDALLAELVAQAAAQRADELSAHTPSSPAAARSHLLSRSMSSGWGEGGLTSAQAADIARGLRSEVDLLSDALVMEQWRDVDEAELAAALLARGAEVPPNKDKLTTADIAGGLPKPSWQTKNTESKQVHPEHMFGNTMSRLKRLFADHADEAKERAEAIVAAEVAAELQLDALAFAAGAARVRRRVPGGPTISAGGGEPEAKLGGGSSSTAASVTSKQTPQADVMDLYGGNALTSAGDVHLLPPGEDPPAPLLSLLLYDKQHSREWNNQPSSRSKVHAAGGGGAHTQRGSMASTDYSPVSQSGADTAGTMGVEGGVRRLDAGWGNGSTVPVLQPLRVISPDGHQRAPSVVSLQNFSPSLGGSGGVDSPSAAVHRSTPVKGDLTTFEGGSTTPVSELLNFIQQLREGEGGSESVGLSGTTSAAVGMEPPLTTSPDAARRAARKWGEEGLSARSSTLGASTVLSPQARVVRTATGELAGGAAMLHSDGRTIRWKIDQLADRQPLRQRRFDMLVNKALSPALRGSGGALALGVAASPVAAAAAALEGRDLVQEMLRGDRGDAAAAARALNTFEFKSSRWSNGLGAYTKRNSVEQKLLSMQNSPGNGAVEGKSKGAQGGLSLSDDESVNSVNLLYPQELALRAEATVEGHALDADEKYLDRVGRLALRVAELRQQEAEEATAAKAKVAAVRARVARRRTERQRGKGVQGGSSTSELTAADAVLTPTEQGGILGKATSTATRLQLSGSGLAYSTRVKGGGGAWAETAPPESHSLALDTDSDSSLGEFERSTVARGAQPSTKLRAAAKKAKAEALQADPNSMSAVRSRRRQLALRTARLARARERAARAHQLAASAVQSTSLAQEELLTGAEVAKRSRNAAKRSALPTSQLPVGSPGGATPGGVVPWGGRPLRQVMPNPHARDVEDVASGLSVGEAGRVAAAVSRRRMTDHLRRVQRSQAMAALDEGGGSTPDKGVCVSGGMTSPRVLPPLRGVSRGGTPSSRSKAPQQREGVIDLLQGSLDRAGEAARGMLQHALRDSEGAVAQPHAVPPTLR